jgi:hypothetical protein
VEGDMDTELYEALKDLISDSNDQVKGTLNDISTKVALMGQGVEALTQTVKTHDDTLYRHNGVKGVVATVDDLVEWKKEEDKKEEERKNEKKDDRKEWKRFKWGVYSSLGFVVLDLVLHLLRIV